MTRAMQGHAVAHGMAVIHHAPGAALSCSCRRASHGLQRHVHAAPVHAQGASSSAPSASHSTSSSGSAQRQPLQPQQLPRSQQQGQGQGQGKGQGQGRAQRQPLPKRRGSIFGKRTGASPNMSPPPASKPVPESAAGRAALMASVEAATSWRQLQGSFLQVAQLPNNYQLLLAITRGLAMLAPGIAAEDVGEVQCLSSELMRTTEPVLHLFSPMEASTLFKSFLALGQQPPDAWLTACEQALLQFLLRAVEGSLMDADDGMALLAAAAMFQTCNHTPQPAFVTALLYAADVAWGVSKNDSMAQSARERAGSGAGSMPQSMSPASVVLPSGEEVRLPSAPAPVQHQRQAHQVQRQNQGWQEGDVGVGEEAAQAAGPVVRPLPAECLAAVARAVVLWGADPLAAAELMVGDSSNAAAGGDDDEVGAEEKGAGEFEMQRAGAGDVDEATMVRMVAAAMVARWRQSLLRASQLAMVATSHADGSIPSSSSAMQPGEAMRYEEGVRYDLQSGELVDVLYGVLAAGAAPDEQWVQAAMTASSALLRDRPRPQPQPQPRYASDSDSGAAAACPAGSPKPRAHKGRFNFGTGADGLMACRSLFTVVGAAVDAVYERTGKDAGRGSGSGKSGMTSSATMPGAALEGQSTWTQGDSSAAAGLGSELAVWVAEVLEYGVDAAGAAAADTASPGAVPGAKAGSAQEAAEAAVAAAMASGAGGLGVAGTAVRGGDVKAQRAAAIAALLQEAASMIGGAAPGQLTESGRAAAVALALHALPLPGNDGDQTPEEDGQGQGKGRSEAWGASLRRRGAGKGGTVPKKAAASPLLSAEGLSVLLQGVLRCGLLLPAVTPLPLLSLQRPSTRHNNIRSASDATVSNTAADVHDNVGSTLPTAWLDAWCDAAVKLGGDAFSPTAVAAVLAAASDAGVRLRSDTVLELATCALITEAKAWASPAPSRAATSALLSGTSDTQEAPQGEGASSASQGVEGVSAASGMGREARVAVLLQTVVQHRVQLPASMLRPLMQISSARQPAMQQQSQQVFPEMQQQQQQQQPVPQLRTKGRSLSLLLLQVSCLVASGVPQEWLATLLQQLQQEGAVQDAAEASAVAAAVGEHAARGQALMPQVESLCHPYLAQDAFSPEQLAALLLAFARTGHVPCQVWWQELLKVADPGSRPAQALAQTSNAAASVEQRGVGGAVQRLQDNQLSVLLAAYCALRSVVGQEPLEAQGATAWYLQLRHEAEERLSLLCANIQLSAQSNSSSSSNSGGSGSSSSNGHQSSAGNSYGTQSTSQQPLLDRQQAAAAVSTLEVLLPGLVVGQEGLQHTLSDKLCKATLLLPELGSTSVVTCCLDLWELPGSFRPAESWLLVASKVAARQLGAQVQQQQPSSEDQGTGQQVGVATSTWAARHTVVLLAALAGVPAGERKTGLRSDATGAAAAAVPLGQDRQPTAAVQHHVARKQGGDASTALATPLDPKVLAILLEHMGQEAALLPLQVRQVLQAAASLTASDAGAPPAARQHAARALAPLLAAAAEIPPPFWRPADIAGLMGHAAALGIRPAATWLQHMLSLLLLPATEVGMSMPFQSSQDRDADMVGASEQQRQEPSSQLVLDCIAVDHKAVADLVSALSAWGVQYTSPGRHASAKLPGSQPDASEGGIVAEGIAAEVPRRLLAALPRLPPYTAVAVVDHLAKQGPLVSEWAASCRSSTNGHEQAVAGGNSDVHGSRGATDGDGILIGSELALQLRRLVRAMQDGMLETRTHAPLLAACARLAKALGPAVVSAMPAEHPSQQGRTISVRSSTVTATTGTGTGKPLPDAAIAADPGAFDGRLTAAVLADACLPYLHTYTPNDLAAIFCSLSSLPQQPPLPPAWLRAYYAACPPAQCSPAMLPRLITAAATVTAASGEPAPVAWLEAMDSALQSAAYADAEAAGLVPAPASSSSSGGSAAVAVLPKTGSSLGPTRGYFTLLQALELAGEPRSGSPNCASNSVGDGRQAASGAVGLLGSTGTRAPDNAGQAESSRGAATMAATSHDHGRADADSSISTWPMVGFRPSPGLCSVLLGLGLFRAEQQHAVRSAAATSASHMSQQHQGGRTLDKAEISTDFVDHDMQVAQTQQQPSHPSSAEPGGGGGKSSGGSGSGSLEEATALAGLLVAIRDALGHVPAPTPFIIARTGDYSISPNRLGAQRNMLTEQGGAGQGWVPRARVVLAPVLQALNERLVTEVEAALMEEPPLSKVASL